MRVRRAFAGSLILAVLMLSAVADRIGLDGLVTLWGVLDGNTQGRSTGTVTIDLRLTLRKSTAYEGDAAAIKPGAHVTVCHRNIGERYLVADRVRVLAAAVPR